MVATKGIVDNAHLDLMRQIDIGAETYMDLRLSLHDKIPEVVPAFSIDGNIVGTKGNFSVISGKAKSKKTFFVSAIVAAVLSGGFGCITSGITGKVLYVDTEQGLAHCHNVLKRIADASGLLPYDIHNRLFFMPLREKNAEDRLKFIEQAIYDLATIGLEFVVIDGIRDLVLDFNNIEESALVTGKLMEWTSKFNIHIICVLHENKGNNDMRGHLGSEAQHKGEAVLQVEKVVDAGYSKISPKAARNIEFPAFALHVGPDGTMSTTKIEGRVRETPIEFDAQVIKNIADGVFREKDVFTSKNALKEAVRKWHFQCMGKPIGDTKARAIVEHMECADLIEITKINSQKMEIRAKKPSFL